MYVVNVPLLRFISRLTLKPEMTPAVAPTRTVSHSLHIYPPPRRITCFSVSPEVIRGHGYSFSCDWWSLGVIIFECLYGSASIPPFEATPRLMPPPPPSGIPPLSAAQSVPPSTFFIFNPTPLFQRHVTRQKILNWKQSLKFPSKPRVSHEGINLMQQLLCEPEDRLGSQTTASVSRPNSLIVQSRRSGFIAPVGQNESVDGAHMIKVRSNTIPGSGWTECVMTRCTRGLGVSTGRTSINTLHHTILS